MKNFISFALIITAITIMFVAGCGGGGSSSLPAAGGADMGRLSASVKLQGPPASSRTAAVTATGTVHVTITVTGYRAKDNTEFAPVSSEVDLDLAVGSAEATIVNVPAGNNHLLTAVADWGGGYTEVLKAVVTSVKKKEVTNIEANRASTVVADAAIAHANANAKFLRDVDLATITSIEGAVSDMQASGVSYSNMNASVVLEYMEVKPTLSSIVISPDSASLAAGGAQQFTATVSKTDNTTVTGAVIAWSVTPSTIGTITTGGLFTAGNISATGTVTASYGTLRDIATVTVNAVLCGNGIMESGETCDDGLNNGQPNMCNSSCSGTTPASCGNGSVETGEDCDDGGESAACNTDCTTASCGDGAVNTAAGETCDDGNTVTETCAYGQTSCTVCNSACSSTAGATSVCGDSITDAGNGETCDDGNTVTETCAYGETSCTVCNAACSSASGGTSYCGDGSTDGTNGEACDDAGESASCDSDCTAASCGDGATNTTAGETCDDGNLDGGDGCAADCSVETLATNAWVTIPAGDFVMGCADADVNCNGDGREAPKHTVTLSEYKIQKYEVTNLQYAECVTAGSCFAPANTISLTRATYYGDSAYDNYPVVYVDWAQATAYCTWKGGRLPTEAEWTKAARGPSPREPIYSWGDAAPDCTLAEYGMATSACTGDTLAIDSHPAGASYYGLLDMTGNVTEWVSDRYDNTYYSTGGPTWIDPPGGAGTQRIMCGGAFRSNTTSLRISNRRGANPTSTYDYAGIRCVKDGPVIPDCGNSIIETGETCDDGGESVSCNLDCSASACGDGVTNATAGETCDDGNTTDSDGCSSICQVEPYCGDGSVDAGETCDDGNTADGDGCSSTCQTEPTTSVLFGGYGGFTDVIQTADGGYVAAGYADVGWIGNNNAWIVKFDSGLNQVWEQYYDATGAEDYATAIVEASDGGVVVAGESNSSLKDVWVRKYDTSGNLVWSFSELHTDAFCGGDPTFGYLYANDLVNVADGGYVLVGEPNCSGPANISTYWMLKLDQSGSEVFKVTAGDGVSTDEPRSIDATSDGGYVITGSRFIPDNGSGLWIYRMFVTKLDASRTETWTQVFGLLTDNTKGTVVRQTADGGYIASGYIEPGRDLSAGAYLYTVKLDASGALVWDNTLSPGPPSSYYWPEAIQPTSDGGYAIAGSNQYSGGEAWIVKLDASGNLVSNQVIGSSTTYIRDMQPTSDGGFVIGGYEGTQGWLKLLDANLQ